MKKIRDLFYYSPVPGCIEVPDFDKYRWLCKHEGEYSELFNFIEEVTEKRLVDWQCAIIIALAKSEGISHDRCTAK